MIDDVMTPEMAATFNALIGTKGRFNVEGTIVGLHWENGCCTATIELGDGRTVDWPFDAAFDADVAEWACG